MGKNVGKMAGKGGNQGSWHNTKTPSTPSSSELIRERESTSYNQLREHYYSVAWLRQTTIRQSLHTRKRT